MSNASTLDNLIHVVPRFARSVSLVRDFHRADALEAYILTPTGRNVLRRLADALTGQTSTRAWSLTGPYGSGKTAFALLAAQALAGEEWVRPKARKFLAAQDELIAERLFGAGTQLSKKAARLCPVLVSGSRQPLAKALAAALASCLRAVVTRGRPPQIVERLEELASASPASGNEVVALFEQANGFLDRYGREAAGILLIVDELGKFLEYGAGNPDQGDVFVLQQLAESATRSKRPFLFLTILHQAIDRYADHMSPGRRAEWAKVQGRFEDVAFEERTEQMLRLLSHAMTRDEEESELKTLRRQGKALAQEVIFLGVRSGAMPAAELQECLAATYPLHPLVVKEVALAILDALAALHENNIVHRDITPKNVLRCDDTWKVADFGISKLTNNPVTGVTFQGAHTKPWAPPEQIEGAPAHPSADVYAFGRVIGFLLTASEEKSEIRKLPAHWAELLSPCVDVVPERRPDVGFLLRRVNEIPR